MAVATRKTGFLFSCIQESSVAKMRWLVPPSYSLEPKLAKLFSSSSIQSTTGAIDSASAITRRKLRSLSPAHFE